MEFKDKYYVRQNKVLSKQNDLQLLIKAIIYGRRIKKKIFDLLIVNLKNIMYRFQKMRIYTRESGNRSNKFNL